MFHDILDFLLALLVKNKPQDLLPFFGNPTWRAIHLGTPEKVFGRFSFLRLIRSSFAHRKLQTERLSYNSLWYFCSMLVWVDPCCCFSKHRPKLTQSLFFYSFWLLVGFGQQSIISCSLQTSRRLAYCAKFLSYFTSTVYWRTMGTYLEV